MKFYEVRFLSPGTMRAGELEECARSAAQACRTLYRILGVTVHARPVDNQDTVAVMILVEGEPEYDETTFDDFAGAMARLHGLPMTYSRLFGESTLSLKNDEEAIDEFIIDSMEADEEFNILLPQDEADEEDDDDFVID